MAQPIALNPIDIHLPTSNDALLDIHHLSVAHHRGVTAGARVWLCIGGDPAERRKRRLASVLPIIIKEIRRGVGDRFIVIVNVEKFMCACMPVKGREYVITDTGTADSTPANAMIPRAPAVPANNVLFERNVFCSDFTTSAACHWYSGALQSKTFPEFIMDANISPSMKLRLLILAPPWMKTFKPLIADELDKSRLLIVNGLHKALQLVQCIDRVAGELGVEPEPFRLAQDRASTVCEMWSLWGDDGSLCVSFDGGESEEFGTGVQSVRNLSGRSELWRSVVGEFEREELPSVGPSSSFDAYDRLSERLFELTDHSLAARVDLGSIHCVMPGFAGGERANLASRAAAAAPAAAAPAAAASASQAQRSTDAGAVANAAPVPARAHGSRVSLPAARDGRRTKMAHAETSEEAEDAARAASARREGIKERGALAAARADNNERGDGDDSAGAVGTARDDAAPAHGATGAEVFPGVGGAPAAPAARAGGTVDMSISPPTPPVSDPVIFRDHHTKGGFDFRQSDLNRSISQTSWLNDKYFEFVNRGLVDAPGHLSLEPNFLSRSCNESDEKFLGWVDGVDVSFFDKDVIKIPCEVNRNHWVLVLVCNLKGLHDSESEQPFVMVIDSCRGRVHNSAITNGSGGPYGLCMQVTTAFVRIYEHQRRKIRALAKSAAAEGEQADLPRWRSAWPFGVAAPAWPTRTVDDDEGGANVFSRELPYVDTPDASQQHNGFDCGVFDIFFLLCAHRYASFLQKDKMVGFKTAFRVRPSSLAKDAEDVDGASTIFATSMRAALVEDLQRAGRRFKGEATEADRDAPMLQSLLVAFESHAVTQSSSTNANRRDITLDDDFYGFHSADDEPNLLCDERMPEDGASAAAASDHAAPDQQQPSGAKPKSRGQAALQPAPVASPASSSDDVLSRLGGKKRVHDRAQQPKQKKPKAPKAAKQKNPKPPAAQRRREGEKRALDEEDGFVDESKKAARTRDGGRAFPVGNQRSCAQDGLINGAKQLGLTIVKKHVYNATLPPKGDTKVETIVNYAGSLGIQMLDVKCPGTLDTLIFQEKGGPALALLNQEGVFFVELLVELGGQPSDRHVVVYNSAYTSPEHPRCRGVIIDNDADTPLKHIEPKDRGNKEDARDVFDSLFPRADRVRVVGAWLMRL